MISRDDVEAALEMITFGNLFVCPNCHRQAVGLGRGDTSWGWLGFNVKYFDVYKCSHCLWEAHVVNAGKQHCPPPHFMREA